MKAESTSRVSGAPSMTESIGRRVSMAGPLLITVAILAPPQALAPVALAGEIWYVDASAAGTNTGEDWDNAFTDLQDGLTVAVAGDSIWVADGTYAPSIPTVPGEARTATFLLPTGVAVYGGFAGGETQLQQRDPALNIALLTGDAAGDDTPAPDFFEAEPTWANNCHHVLTCEGGSATTVLDGFLVTHGVGYFFDMMGGHPGGGLLLNNASPTINQCTFELNFADGGGAIRSFAGDPVITACVFRDNLAAYFCPWGSCGTSSGGAVDTYDGIIQLTNCLFEDNYAAEGLGGAVNVEGGAAFLMDCIFIGNGVGTIGRGGGLRSTGDVILDGCLFEGNTCSDFLGGGLYNGGNAFLIDCAFTANEAGTVFDGWGGGMANDGVLVVEQTSFLDNAAFTAGTFHQGSGSATFTDCSFQGSFATVGSTGVIESGDATFTRCVVRENPGGIIVSDEAWFTECRFIGNAPPPGFFYGPTGIGNEGVIEVLNCTFLGNETADAGAAISNRGSAVAVNCLFSGNVAEYNGGAVYNWGGGDLTLINCTFSANHADAEGGGIFISDGSVAIANGVLWGNDDAGGGGEAAQVTLAGGTLAVGYSCVQGWSGAHGGVGNTGDDPLLADPPGPDGLPGTEDDNLWLSPGSPCIDAGDNTAVPPGVLSDLDGNLRFLDDPATPDTGAGAAPYIDMGPFEYQGSTACPADVNGDSVVNALDILAVLAAWGQAGGPTDINGDGVVDVLDILLVLADWGPCG